MSDRATAAAGFDSSAFVDILGPGPVSGDALDVWAVDGRQPGVAIRPPDEEAAAATLQTAAAQGLGTVPHGGGTMRGLGNPVRAYDVALDLSALEGIVAYEPEDFTIRVRGGTPLEQLQRMLVEQGQFVPLDAPAVDRATVGGVLAVGRGGLRRPSIGYPRDWLIGVRALLADGTPVQGGGQVVKNVSGYDLPKLFCGSLGTLGVIVDASFKLRPLPAFDALVTIPAPDFAIALAAADAGQRAAPVLSGAVALDAGAAARAGLDSAPAVVLRAAGLEGPARQLLEQASSAGRGVGLSGQGDPAIEPHVWQAIVDLESEPAAGATRLRCAILPAKLAQALDVLEQHFTLAERWAGPGAGLLFAVLDDAQPDALAAARAAIEKLGGHLTIETAPAVLKQAIDVWGAPGGGLEIMQRIKNHFDPQGLLNPGRFVGGLA